MAKSLHVARVPADAHSAVRLHLGLSQSDPVRVVYIPGPGDLVGTYRYWLEDRYDPRVPIIAYSLMFYELMEIIGADWLTISLGPVEGGVLQIGNRSSFQQLEQSPSNSKLGYQLGRHRFANSICSAVEKYSPHIVVTSTHNPVRSWRKLSNGYKLILTAHNTFWPQGRQPNDLKGRLKRAYLSSQATALDGAVCTSHECAHQIADITNKRVSGEVACPQIVHSYRVEQRSDVRKILFIGRIEEPKGIFLLLDVFEEIADRYPQITLNIAGDGGAMAELKQRFLQSAFSHRITLLGRIDSEGVHSEIAACDLVVCPTMTSFNEGLAVVGFEAAAHGIPTLLSSVVPAAHLLGDSCTVFEADSAASLREALSNLIENPSNYLDRCAATVAVRDMIYDRSLSWGSALYRAIMAS